MRNTLKTIKMMLLMAIALIVMGASPVRADSVLYSSTTNGVFTSTSSPTTQGLTFTPQPTSNLSIGSAPLSVRTGFFTLGGANGVYSDTFTLNLLISSPTGSIPSNVEFLGLLSGVVSGGTSNLTLTFPSRTRSVIFSNSVGSGSFTLTLPESLSLTEFSTPILLPVTIQLTSFAPTPTPEPATLFLMGTSIIGLSAVIRKRRRSLEQNLGY